MRSLSNFFRPNLAPRFLLPLACAALACAAPAGEQLQPPRYKFEVGQELIYEEAASFEYNKRSDSRTERTTLWVTRQNDDGSWHIIARNESTFIYGGSQGAKPRADETLHELNVFADGRVAAAPQGRDSGYRPRVLLRLPADAAAARAGWETQEDFSDSSLCRLAPSADPAAGKWIIEEEMKNEVYLSTTKSAFSFDAARGLVTRIETEYTQGAGYGGGGKGRGLIELKSAEQKDPAWLAQLAQEFDALSRAGEAVGKARVALKDGATLEEARAGAEKALREDRAKVKLPMVDAQFGAYFRSLEPSLKYFSEDLKKEREVVNLPAAEWETTDLDGQKHALADYRGQVVVLDFWYRGCGWCIKAMPQIKKVAERFRGKPVAVLGMNTDINENDARFVAEKLKLNYPTLKARKLDRADLVEMVEVDAQGKTVAGSAKKIEPDENSDLAKKYKVTGFPTLIIIDQKGIVRARHAGYSPTLAEEVGKTIDGLLAGDAPPAK